jgi:hypothetical protein
MRVLWVEDFGGGSVPESILDVVFKGVLTEGRRDSLAGTQGLAGTICPQGYSGWRTWHGSQPISDEPEIDIYRRAKDFDDLVSSGYIVDRYDAVLLDVNLENHFFESGAELNRAEGGFWLYNKLVRAGFPSGRIALLTAHTREDATTEFQTSCLRQNQEELLSFDKTNQDAGDWIMDLAKAHSGFMHLRRGVLDGITFAEDLLKQHGDEAIRFNRYVRNEERLSFDQALDYLCSMRHLLPLSVSDAEIDLQLRGFRNHLGCVWERANPTWGSDSYYQALGWAMKYLRNWSSHGHLLDRASVGDISYLVLAGLRSGFLVPGNAGNEIRPYEHHLLSAMGAENIDFTARSKRLSNSYLDARRHLRQRIGNPSRLRKDKQPVPLEDRKAFREIVNGLAIAAAPPADFDFPSALRELFVHVALSPTYPAIVDDDAVNMQGVEAAYSAALQTQSATLPVWVKATWARL